MESTLPLAANCAHVAALYTSISPRQPTYLATEETSTKPKVLSPAEDAPPLSIIKALEIAAKRKPRAPFCLLKKRPGEGLVRAAPMRTFSLEIIHRRSRSCRSLSPTAA